MNKVYSLGLMGILLGLSGCDLFKSNSSQEVSTAQLRVVNVLDPDMYADAHIKGSINIPFDEVEGIAQQWNKNDTLVFYCSNYACTASGQVARELKADGFENVFAYEGGMAEWFQRAQQDPNFKVEGPAQQSYLTQVMQAPEHQDANVQLITADALRDKLVQASELNY